mmetsp:Transcript_70135/g.116957  ORF Transcript_70135/g.116957 Transcript_70135/m.116957 type:complete len:228 (+) Transcript_70135:1466-2149(+)
MPHVSGRGRPRGLGDRDVRADPNVEGVRGQAEGMGRGHGRPPGQPPHLRDAGPATRRLRRSDPPTSRRQEAEVRPRGRCEEGGAVQDREDAAFGPCLWHPVAVCDAGEAPRENGPEGRQSAGPDEREGRRGPLGHRYDRNGFGHVCRPGRAPQWDAWAARGLCRGLRGRPGSLLHSILLTVVSGQVSAADPRAAHGSGPKLAVPDGAGPGAVRRGQQEAPEVRRCVP